MVMRYFFPVLATLRVRQWVKNAFVLAPLVFAQRLFEVADTLHALGMAVAFCAASSSVYFFNDLRDREHDRIHPSKRYRPIASGHLPVHIAQRISAVLALVALAGSWITGGWAGTAITAGYLLLNIAYSLYLKTVAYIDVLSISAGFLLRVTAGAVAVNVPLSSWLLIMTPVLAAYLGFGKRLHERLLSVDRTTTDIARPGLAHYHPRTLFIILLFLEINLPFLFFAYTQATPNHQTMVVSIPFLAGALHRFLQICTTLDHWESPTDRMLTDPAFLLLSTGWILTVGYVLYLAW